MKYILQSLKYIFKNFLYIFPFAVLPALLLTLSSDKTTLSKVLENYFTGTPHASFPAIFKAISFLNFHSWWAALAAMAGIVLATLCCSMMFALMEKHMRIGKLTFNGIFSKLNDNIVSTCGVCLLYAFIYELWALILSALLFFVSLPNSNVAVYIMSALIFFGGHYVLLYVVSLFYLWLPCLQITGFRAFEALRYSYQLVAPVKQRVIAGQLVSVFLAEALIGLCSIFLSGNIAYFVIVTLIYAFLIMLFCVRMQVVYFDRAQMERADLKRYY